jgi:hypothetical protein
MRVVQPLCTEVEPELELHGGATLAACHFPLTAAEVSERLRGWETERPAGSAKAKQPYAASRR